MRVLTTELEKQLATTALDEQLALTALKGKTSIQHAIGNTRHVKNRTRLAFGKIALEHNNKKQLSVLPSYLGNEPAKPVVQFKYIWVIQQIFRTLFFGDIISFGYPVREDFVRPRRIFTGTP